MTCDLICCRVDRARADRGPGRRNLQPLYSPTVAGSPSAAVGGTTTSTPTEHAAVARMVADDGGVGVLVPSGVRRHG